MTTVVIVERIGLDDELLRTRAHGALDFVSHAAQELDLRPFVEGAAGTEAS